MGKRTAMRRSARCFEPCVLVGIIGAFLVSKFRIRLTRCVRLALKKPFHCIEHFTRRPCFVNRSSELASISNTVRKPASELLHFSHSVGLVR
jgi:hypothetical protein